MGLPQGLTWPLVRAEFEPFFFFAKMAKIKVNKRLRDGDILGEMRIKLIVHRLSPRRVEPPR